jgi:hypothetical protein
VLVAALLGAIVGSCHDPNGEDVATARPPIELHAFPNVVKPGGSVAVVIVVRGECAKRPSTCTVCIGLPPDRGAHTSGEIYWPGVVAGGDPHVLRVASVPLDEPVTTTYRAPASEGAEVVTATLFGASVDCAKPGGDAGDRVTPAAGTLISSTSVRITIAAAGATAGSAAEGGAADAPSADASPEATTDTGASDGAADVVTE